MDSFEQLKQDCSNCSRCILGATRKNLVFGTGNEHSDLVFVGEGPGEKEDQQGIPFVGPAGQLLDVMLKLIGLRREDVYICNIVKCRPPQNRDPAPDEREACSQWLQRQTFARSGPPSGHLGIPVIRFLSILPKTRRLKMIRFYNGKVLRFEPDMRLTDDEVWTEGNRISYVGPAKEALPAFDRQIDLHGDLLMPGFKNAHTHTAMTFLRSLADDMELQSWLKKVVWPNEAKLTDDAVYILTKLGILEYLSSGITASFDMYVHNEAYARANVDAGFRTVICSGLNNFDADPKNIDR